MSNPEEFVSAQQLAATNRARYPNESAEYRAARNALLAEEIELRRHLERVAEQRRALQVAAKWPRTTSSSRKRGRLLSQAFLATRTRS